jgi:HSP20 family protein
MLLARPFPMMLDFERAMGEMSRMFDLFDGPLGLRSMPRGTFPAVNLYDNQTELVLTAEIPGVKIADIGLSVAENTVTLTGKRNGAECGKTDRCYRQERPMGQFERTITLGEKIDAGAATADYQDGILTVRLPKVKVTAPKILEIKPK